MLIDPHIPAPTTCCGTNVVQEELEGDADVDVDGGRSNSRASSSRRLSEPEGRQPQLERLRTLGMTVKQKVADVVNTTNKKVALMGRGKEDDTGSKEWGGKGVAGRRLQRAAPCP
jgi:hypothetical protein